MFSNLSSSSRWHCAQACRPVHVQTPSKKKLQWGICHYSSILPSVLACLESSCGNWPGRGFLEAVCGQGRQEKFQFASLAGLRSTIVILEMPSGRGLFFPLKESGILSSEWEKRDDRVLCWRRDKSYMDLVLYFPLSTLAEVWQWGWQTFPTWQGGKNGRWRLCL